MRWQCYRCGISIPISLHQELHVFPDLSFGGRVAQEIGGVVGDQDLGPAPGVQATAQASQRTLGGQQGGSGHRSQAADVLGSNDLQLSFKKRTTMVRLLGRGRAVLRRSALEDIQDIDILHAASVQASMILFSNWPARPTNGSPCRSSSAPGCFAEETQTRLRAARCRRRSACGWPLTRAESTAANLIAERLAVGTACSCSDERRDPDRWRRRLMHGVWGLGGGRGYG